MDTEKTLQELSYLRRDSLRVLASLIRSDNSPSVVRLQAAQYVLDTLLRYHYTGADEDNQEDEQ